jgi:ATP-dependent DNA ligase
MASSVVDRIPNAEMVQHIEGHHAADLWQAFVVDGKGEGLVFRRSGDGYAKATLGRVKVQPTMDYVVMRVVEGGGKHVGRLGAIVCGLYEDGKLVEKVSVGGGFSDSVREVLWASRSRLVGKVIEVRGYGVFNSGSMRHPQFSMWRDDKPASDCVWDG